MAELPSSRSLPDPEISYPCFYYLKIRFTTWAARKIIVYNWVLRNVVNCILSGKQNNLLTLPYCLEEENSEGTCQTRKVFNYEMFSKSRGSHILKSCLISFKPAFRFTAANTVCIASQIVLDIEMRLLKSGLYYSLLQEA